MMDEWAELYQFQGLKSRAEKKTSACELQLQPIPESSSLPFLTASL